MYRDITLEDALALENKLLIDVRSEKEYAEDTIPGAVNIPVLNNEERASVGLTYRQDGPATAVRMGLSLVSPVLSEKLAAIDSLAAGRNLVVFCWRGGQRSQFMASVLDTVGYLVYRVEGGYKAYRNYVNRYLSRQGLPLWVVVLHGLTGVGKTEVLAGLARKGIPVLDLEGLARHRGSVYGKIGLPPSPTQKAFESSIVQILLKASAKGVFVVECESRRLGNLLVPPLVMDFIRQGSRLLLYASMADRVRRIIADYTCGPDHHIDELQQATAALVKILGKARVAELNEMIARKEFARAFAYLLEYHYDPLYQYPAAPSADFELCVDTAEIEAAVKIIADFIEARLEKPAPVAPPQIPG
ncbi:MAG: tRNA 2-selenouridine synthase [Pelotomaculum sp. PtaB.Bin104]|nr:MAG: tRNA 2-selenouridine synthase [Pelotomaculum sp. PtaB.Bin104]